MEINKQSQTAGDNARQLQAGSIGNLTIINGISEQRAREIFQEMNEVARRDYTNDAYELARSRIAVFESLLMDKVREVDRMLEEFGDPSFQYLLADAQRRAAASERESDYATLTELLACRVTHKDNRKIRTGITHAVKIVDELDDDALCALTIYYFYRCMSPLAETCADGLDCLEEYANKLLVTTLPVGNDWIDHLEILNAVRRIYFTAQPKFEEMMFRKLPGYVCVGINKESEDYKKALDILAKHRMSENILVEHDLLKGYVRIPIPNESRIRELRATEIATGSVRRINGQEIIALKQVWSLYSQDTNLLAKVKSNFVIELQKRAALNKIRLWWNRIPMEIEITQVGNVLAHANAQRIDNSVPDFL